MDGDYRIIEAVSMSVGSRECHPPGGETASRVGGRSAVRDRRLIEDFLPIDAVPLVIQNT